MNKAEQLLVVLEGTRAITLKDIGALSSGTMATWTGIKDTASLDKIQNAFYIFAEKCNIDWKSTFHAWVVFMAHSGVVSSSQGKVDGKTLLRKIEHG